MKFSVLILTKNSENIIDKLLTCLTSCDDVVVVNDRSKDDTAGKVRKYKNARLFETIELAKNIPNLDSQKELFWGDEAYLRNLLLNKIDYKYEWILILDSDERISKSALGLLKTLKVPEQYVAISLIRYDNFLGKRLKYSQQVSSYIRLIKRNYCIYKRPINSFLYFNGKEYKTNISFDHFPFINGIESWIDRHIEYSKLESKKANLASNQIKKVFNIKTIITSPIRQLYKNIFYLLFLRGILKFILLYIIRFGFLDGLPGYLYCSIICWYETLIEVRQRINLFSKNKI